MTTKKLPSTSTVNKPAVRSTSGNHQAVLAGQRVVVVAKQQHLVDERSDPPGRTFDQPQPQVVGRILDAIKVAAQPPVGRGQRDAAGVGELIALRIEVVTEADRFGESVDALSIAGEKVPTVRRAIATIGPHVAVLFLGRQFGRFARIKADGDHLVIAADLQRHGLAALEEAIEYLRA